VNRKHRVVSTAVGTALIGSVGLAVGTQPGASAGPSMPSSEHIMIGPTGNKLEMVRPDKSHYIPDIAGASARDRARAQRILDGVNRFCDNHTVAQLRAHWRPGSIHKKHPTHYFNPRPRSTGLHPANPKAALVYHGRIGGVMFNGYPLPHLGSIPRAHMHHDMPKLEMLHVYCVKSLKKAYTPNRMLGVKAGMIALRLKIRPAIMDLSWKHLRAVRHKVRGYAGSRLHHVKPIHRPGPGPAPLKLAMQREIRHSLMILNERQLRSVWRLMQSY
jgi:hypothetical protein